MIALIMTGGLSTVIGDGGAASSPAHQPPALDGEEGIASKPNSKPSASDVDAARGRGVRNRIHHFEYIPMGYHARLDLSFHLRRRQSAVFTFTRRNEKYELECK